MAIYKILAVTVTGKGRQIFKEGDLVDGTRFANAEHLPELIAAGCIVEYTPAVEKADKLEAEQKVDLDLDGE